MNETKALAVTMSKNYPSRRVFLTQTGAESFNFHFDAYNPMCGPLVAVFLAGAGVAK